MELLIILTDYIGALLYVYNNLLLFDRLSLSNIACISIRDLFKRSFVRFTNPSALTFRFSILLLEILPSKIYVSTFFLSVDQNVYTRILCVS